MRDGKAFIASLKDDREVWIDGERVKDVTQHPALAPAIEATAHLYDMQYDAALSDRLAWTDQASGETVGRTFQPPRTHEDLVARREATRLWMETSCGFMGRAPDFLNTVLMSLKAGSRHFAQQSKERQQAVEAYADFAAREDLFLTHGLNDPLPNKTKARHMQEDKGVVLHVEEETKDGLIVSGAKVVATAAAYANDALMFPMPNNQVPGDEPYALAICIPVAMPGLKIICRGSFMHTGRHADFPLSSRFDEMDSVLVFDRVLVPWDRVFLHGDVGLMNGMYGACKVREMTAHQTNVRLLVKMEFLYALLVQIARMLGYEDTPWVAQALGETAAWVEMLRASILTAEREATRDPVNGILYPELSSISIGRVMGPRIYGETVQKIRRLAGSTLMQAPGSLSILESEVGDLIDRFYKGTGAGTREKISLARLAWDVCGTEFGSRHQLYELFYAGDPDALMGRYHKDYAAKDRHLATFERAVGRLASE